MLFGLLNLSFWGYVIALLILTHITIIGVTVYLHRSQAHRSLDLHPVLSHFFRFWMWLTTGMETKEWVAIHRKHHAKCETEEDPHSPQVKGIKKVFFEGAELYREESKNMDTMERYGQGTPDDWMERNVYSKHSVMGIVSMFIIDVVLFGIPGVTIWALQMLWIPLFAAGVVNGIGHYWGYRNFECPDAARNLLPLGAFIGGEELHNNHHTFPTSAKLSVKPWEFDLGWAYIRLFQALKLAKVKRVSPQLKETPGKRQVDLDTLAALITNRFQVMARYSKEVLLPVLEEETEKASTTMSKALLKRAKISLIRTESLLNDERKQQLADIIKKHDMLALVYQYRLRLQDIWCRTTATQRELLEALQEWCKQAEATGICVLRKFAANLAGISTHKKLS
ncbi:DesA family fatty acid desaturase [Rickettsiella endosymbiont of Dermanyssus gallinae]|uniref:DesA family fatty acid desaturase n=1 Tax=Rickettsiella endosymbiont of Dermanyssus gallinae TaxID=2856608 RepID=UPI001C52DDF4|nr:fatty acid desaturase [Rickettsiella endosymbiont of Dermanyssus gallinae]